MCGAHRTLNVPHNTLAFSIKGTINRQECTPDVTILQIGTDKHNTDQPFPPPPASDILSYNRPG